MYGTSLVYNGDSQNVGWDLFAGHISDILHIEYSHYDS